MIEYTDKTEYSVLMKRFISIPEEKTYHFVAMIPMIESFFLSMGFITL